MGHRGAAGAAPENTLAGLRHAAAIGLSWVEFDVMLTGDGVPVLFHDDMLTRTTGHAAPMAGTPHAVVRTLDAGAWFHADHAGEGVPTLEAALAEVLTLGLRANIEIKPTPGTERETAVAALEVLIRCWPPDRPPPLISSFKRASLAVALERAPQWPRALIVRRPPRDWRRAAVDLQCSAVHASARWLSKRRVAEIKQAGYGVAAFTVNDPSRARKLIARGVDCLITDEPALILTSVN